jgi:glycosyltransferase involved in cell wall biosynthesis
VGACDLVCFSHLRWDFVYQRPQHLLARAARNRRVFFFEEPVHDEAIHLEQYTSEQGVRVCKPHLPAHLPESETLRIRGEMLRALFAEHGIENPVHWYYSPMFLPLGSALPASLVVYDCMDELASFKFAPESLLEREKRLLERADLVFTGGQSLYEAKRARHPQVFAFPSSVDVPHFASAREAQPQPAELAAIPHPRLGYMGVIDERMDLDLLAAVAEARPDWSIVLLGPVVKIRPEDLPQFPNVHAVGGRSYGELPGWLAHLDVALMPFARNEATRFISPTKTPEYLAAGLPVVSTPIRDVVAPYGEMGIVAIAETPEAFVAACESALTQGARTPSPRQARADQILAQTSWDRTWSRMEDLIDTAIDARVPARSAK